MRDLIIAGLLIFIWRACCTADKLSHMTWNSDMESLSAANTKIHITLFKRSRTWRSRYYSSGSYYAYTPTSERKQGITPSRPARPAPSPWPGRVPKSNQSLYHYIALKWKVKWVTPSYLILPAFLPPFQAFSNSLPIFQLEAKHKFAGAKLKPRIFGLWIYALGIS